MGPKLELLTPWEQPYSPSGIQAELLKEIGPEHPLYEKAAIAVAVARDRDDVLFRIEGPDSSRYAVVHLTWSQHREPQPWPETQFFDTLDQWIDFMKADHADYTYGEG